MNKSDRNELREIYTRAAELIYEDLSHFSCIAISRAEFYDEYALMKYKYRERTKISAREYYESIFDCEDTTFTCMYLSYYGPSLSNPTGLEMKEIRILALCFAAAIAESGDLEKFV
jgi:hypothetical protein